MPIDGIAIAGYRSFGPELQFIAPLGRMNILIGQNNSGKSNFLYLLKDHYANLVKLANGESPKMTFAPDDRHLGDPTGMFRVGFPVEVGGAAYNTVLAQLKSGRASEGLPVVKDILDTILSGVARTVHSSCAWFVYETRWAERVSKLTPSQDQLLALVNDKGIDDASWYSVVLATGSSGGMRKGWVEHVIRLISPMPYVVQGVPKAFCFVPAIRRAEPGDWAQSIECGGKGLIDRLAQLQNPRHDQQELRGRFEAVNALVREVTGEPTAQVEVPFARDTLVVHLKGKALPLERLGTGLHELVIIAAAAAVIDKGAVCLEEPEIHLHPILQKKLVRHLLDRTSNQYFISTHSAHLMDTPGATVFHVALEAGATRVQCVVTNSAKSEICSDLGYRPSDLLQANCVIWVEGPSDRVYINAWLRAQDSGLTEGVHYAIMFYAGRLLSHLSAEDVDLDEFISLCRLNRSIALVMDSDRKSDGGEISETKKRIKGEIDNQQGLSWVTAGREIENYIPDDKFLAALKVLKPEAAKLADQGSFSDRSKYMTATGEAPKGYVDKVKIARDLAANAVDLEVSDLREQVNRLVEFIRKANGLTPKNEDGASHGLIPLQSGIVAG